MPAVRTRLLLFSATAVVTAAGVATATAAAPPKTPPKAPPVIEAVPPEAFVNTVVDVTVYSASGAVLEQPHCEWVEPEADDRRCQDFMDDPVRTIRSLKEIGGVRTATRLTQPDAGTDVRSTVTRLDDGRWLFKADGVMRGGSTVRMRTVCSASGRQCDEQRESRSRSKKKLRRKPLRRK